MHKKMERARFNLAPTKTELMENLYHKRMNENMKNAFGADYLDTKNNESAHIRNMFKDWDREIYRQELARTAQQMKLQITFILMVQISRNKLMMLRKTVLTSQNIVNKKYKITYMTEICPVCYCELEKDRNYVITSCMHIFFFFVLLVY